MARRTSSFRAADDAWLDEFAELVQFAEELPERFLECRELGHLWRPWAALSNPDGGYDRTLRCTRCQTKREQIITSRGVVTSNRYIHPEGYLHKGMGRIVGDGRGLLRLTSVKRQAIKMAEKAESNKRKAS